MTYVKFRKPMNQFPVLTNLFDEIWNDWSRLPGTEQLRTVPAVNIREDKEGFVLEVAAPGLSKDLFNIHVDGDLLTIEVAAQEGNEQEEGTFKRREFNYLGFKRSFRLAKTADAEKIGARYEDGILYLAIPKREEVKPRTIVIE